MPAKINWDEERVKPRELDEEKRVENKINLSRIELIILNQLQYSGSISREKLFLPAPLAHRADEGIASLQQRGYLIEEDDVLYYCNSAHRNYKH